MIRIIDGALARLSKAWDKLLHAAPLRIWAIILGAPPMCALVAYVINHLAHLAVQPEPVREALALAIANIGYGMLGIVAVIVCALAAVSLVVRGPSGWTMGINDDDDDDHCRHDHHAQKPNLQHERGNRDGPEPPV